MGLGVDIWGFAESFYWGSGSQVSGTEIMVEDFEFKVSSVQGLGPGLRGLGWRTVVGVGPWPL